MPININNEIKAEKTELRKTMSKTRSAIDRVKKFDYDAEIQSRVLALRDYAKTDILFTYLSMDTEPSTRALVYAAWANGKRIAVPKCNEETMTMTFYIIKSMKDVKPGYYGIMEPDPEVCEQVKDLSHGLCVVPGLSFDAEGYRLGYGRGYYDRFLKHFRGVSVGLCYSSYLKLKLPRGAYDVPVNLIATEQFVRNTNP